MQSTFLTQFMNLFSLIGGKTMRELLALFKFIIGMALFTAMIIALFLIWLLVHENIIKF